jgi:hypothetical protein
MMLSPILCLLFAAASGPVHPNLADVKAVYFLPMGAGLDQYLAIRMTEKQIFRVVTDPNLADAIFTDRIGEGLEDRLAELYPQDQPKKDVEATEKDANDWATQKPVRSASFSRGKGTIFLVDRKSRDVVWSLYAPPKSTRPEDLNRNASSIAKKIEEALRPPKSTGTGK